MFLNWDYEFIHQSMLEWCFIALLLYCFIVLGNCWAAASIVPTFRHGLWRLQWRGQQSSPFPAFADFSAQSFGETVESVGFGVDFSPKAGTSFARRPERPPILLHRSTRRSKCRAFVPAAEQTGFRSSGQSISQFQSTGMEIGKKKKFSDIKTAESFPLTKHKNPLRNHEEDWIKWELINWTMQNTSVYHWLVALIDWIVDH